MKKNSKQIEGRKALVKMAINDKEKAVEYIKRAAETLNESQTIEQIIYCLSDILFLSERTIENDLYNKEKPQTLQKVG